MDTLVDRPNLTIKVRDMSNLVVCVACRGSGDRYVSGYDSGWRLGERWMFGHYEGCRKCGARGYYEAAPSPDARGA